jgi:hypothetical protein
VAGTRCRQCLPHCGFGDQRQAARHGPVVDGLEAGLGEHPQRISLAGRLDDPRHHQITEHLVPAGGRIEAEHLVGPAQAVPQVAGLGGDDLQRLTIDPGRVQPEIKRALAFGQALAGRGLERCDFGIVVGRAQMLNLARAASGRPHDLHRDRPRGGLHGAYVGHQSTLRTQN